MPPRAAGLVRRPRISASPYVVLLEDLGYSWQEVHDEAERLEHAVSDEFTERLAEMLGHPGRDPHGDPIPAADGTLAPERSSPLSEAKAGQRVRISKVSDASPEVLHHLGERGLVPGRVLEVGEVRALDGVVAVEDEEGKKHALGGEPLARDIFVQELPG